MYPAYRWTDSYPNPFNDRRPIEIPSHMKMDPSTLNAPYQPYPNGSNYYYTVPHEHHSCCHHGCFGGCPYSFRHPYPHYPPPPPPSPYGFYPPFPGTYPGYSNTPPHYMIEQPRYDYDKNTHAKTHCEGCNHREDDKKLKIEQEEPEVDKKPSNSMVPFLKDYPYPIMWVPPHYMDSESKPTEKEKHSRDPVSLKPLEYMTKGGNSETAQDQQGELGEDGNRFPFQIFWLPNKSNEVGKDSKENGHNQVAHKELPSFGGDDNKKPTRKTDEDLDSGDKSEMNRNLAAQRVIPMRQLGIDEEKKSPMEAKANTQKVIPVKQLGTDEEKKSLKVKSSVAKTDNGIEGKNSPRSSKLPPVCLRLDPLPKKKKSSRSPSPPADKGRSEGLPADDSKSAHQHTQLSEGLKKSKDEQPKGNVKTIKVVDDDNRVENDGVVENILRNQEIKAQGKDTEKEVIQDPADDSKSSQQKTELSEGLKKSKEEETEGNIKTIEVTNDANEVENDKLSDFCKNVLRNLEIKDQGEGNEGEKEVIQDQSGKVESCKVEKKNLSENEAALIIQSVYRGFEVRKSQPLMKLRQIAAVGKEMIKLRNRIQDLESSTSTVGIDDKQKLIIGETIMSLLLKLDTIQGLHPVVRDIRKSVAKELVGLQEKLDSLTSVKPETPSEVVHPEAETETTDHEKSDEAQVQRVSGSGLCENRELEPTSQRIDEFNQLPVPTEQPADDAIQVKSEPTQAQNLNVGLDTGIFDNHEVEAEDSVREPQIIKPEQLVEPSMEELNSNQLHEIQEKPDEAHAESDTNVETMESDEHHGVEAAGTQDNGDAADTNLEPQVDLKNQQESIEHINNQLEMPGMEQPVEHKKSDQARPQFESDGEHLVSSEQPEVEAKGSQEDGNVQNYNKESMEAENDVSMVEMADGEHMVSSGHPEAESEKSQDDDGMKICDKEHTHIDSSVVAEMTEVEAVLPPPEEAAAKGIQEELSVSTEEAPNVDDDVNSSTEASVEDLGGAPQLPTSGGDQEEERNTQIENMDSDKMEQEDDDSKTQTEYGIVSTDDGKKLMEENKKLHEAVVELMKAGNEQMKVIKELTGRVKDLEKKLSVSKNKKKKIKLRKCTSPASATAA